MTRMNWFAVARQQRAKARELLRECSRLALKVDPESLPPEMRRLREQASTLLDKAERAEAYAEDLKALNARRRRRRRNEKPRFNWHEHERDHTILSGRRHKPSNAVKRALEER